MCARFLIARLVIPVTFLGPELIETLVLGFGKAVFIHQNASSYFLGTDWSSG